MITVEEKYFTVPEIAERLKVTRQAIYNWIKQGRLRAVKVGSDTRIPESALLDFLKPTDGDEKAQD